MKMIPEKNSTRGRREQREYLKTNKYKVSPSEKSSDEKEEEESEESEESE